VGVHGRFDHCRRRALCDLILQLISFFRVGGKLLDKLYQIGSDLLDKRISAAVGSFVSADHPLPFQLVPELAYLVILLPLFPASQFNGARCKNRN
jgi:hypothetical protein